MTRPSRSLIAVAVPVVLAVLATSAPVVVPAYADPTSPVRANPAGAAPRAAEDCDPKAVTGVVFVLDDSGSMRNNDPEQLRATATEIGVRTLPASSYVDVVTFASTSSTIVRPTRLTDDAARDDIADTVRSKLFSNGGTRYQQAFTQAVDELEAFPDVVTDKAVIFLSDGEPEDRDYTAHLDVAEQGVPIYSIGFGTASFAELSKISDASPGGTAQVVSSASETQSAVAGIVAAISCSGAVEEDVITLQPGKEELVPFTVPDTFSSFDVVATWPQTSVTMRIERPDRSHLDGASVRAGEKFDAGDTFARASSVTPERGTWVVKLRSSSGVPVSVNIQVFAQEIDRDPTKPPTTSAACRKKKGRTSATFLDRTIWAGCLVKESGNLRATGSKIKINGLVIQPQGSVLIRRDGHLEGKGKVGFEVSLLGSVHTTTIAVPDLGFIQLDQDFGIDDALGNAILAAAAAPFKVADGLSLSAAWTDTTTREPGTLKLTMAVTFGGGLLQPVAPVTTPLSKEPKTEAEFNQFGFAVQVSSSNAGGTIVDALELNLGLANAWGRVGLKAVHLVWKPSEHQAGGGATFELASGVQVSVDLLIDYKTGLLPDFSIAVDVVEINKPISTPPVVFLQRISGGFSNLDDDVAISGGVGLSLLPEFELGGREIGLLGIDGDLTLLINALRLTAEGTATLFGAVTLAESNVQVDARARTASASGQIGFSEFGVTLQGGVSGSIDLSGSSPEVRLLGETTVDAPFPIGSQKAQTLLTTKGAGFCAFKTVGFPIGPSKTFSIGGVIRYDDITGSLGDIAKGVFGGCDFEEIDQDLSRGARRTGSVTVVGPGRIHAVLVPTTTSAVNVTTSGDDGDQSVTVPAAKGSHVEGGHVVAERLAGGQVMALVETTGVNTITVTNAAGSPITGLRTSKQLSTPTRAAGSVATRDDGRRTITYRLAGLEPGDSVQIVSDGATSRPQTVAKGAPARGSLTFRPSLGAGSRIVTAIITRAGAFRAAVPLTSYGASVKPAKARALTINRKKVIRWKAPKASGVTGYQIRVKLPDGRVLQARIRRTSLKLVRPPRRFTALVSVTALYKGGLPAPALTKRLTVKPPRKRSR